MGICINRRQILKLSLLSGLAISVKNLYFKQSTKNKPNVVSFYKILVPEDSLLYGDIKKTGALTDLNVFAALALSSFDTAWAMSYDEAKSFAIKDSILLGSEKIYSSKNRSLYIKSTWSCIDDYLKFLNVANMKSFHDELKKNGFQPELKVFGQFGKEYPLSDYT